MSMMQEKIYSIDQGNITIPIHFEQQWVYDLQQSFKQDGPWDLWEAFQLAYQAEEVMQIKDFNELQCLAHLPYLTPFPHQIETAKKVLNEMHGRAILADEVGLGKTIEAGLIMKEYLIRGLAKKILILVPASLVLQWTRELNHKLGIPAVAQKKEWMWDKYDIIVASMDTAKRPPHVDYVLNQHYDMLVVDEAHKLKNKNTKNWEFINKIKKKFILLLTATPIQNDMTELYNLVTLLKPGQLGRYYHFQKEHMKDKRNPKNKEILRQEIEKVMIRNKRSDEKIEIEFPQRIVKTIPIELTAPERELYDEISSFVRGYYRQLKGDIQNMLSLITLQREICSSRDAAFITLVNMFKKSGGNEEMKNEILRLVQIAKKVETQSKADKIISLIKEINDKVIIFTEYRATQEFLITKLKEQGITSVPYRGGFNRGKKDWMMDLFQRKAQVMVATEAGGEGINLQFCNQIINYDMPWNPMKVEQRIGRVHRLGQTRNVYIYNLSTNQTIEEHILYLLHEKINMFENVIGSLDVILEKLKLIDLENNIMKMMIGAKDNEDFKEKLSQIGNHIVNGVNG
ncbi:DEAD/DEAH box helicase [Tepidibacillus sp. HK-1]|uniref:DEAD/DEAH box helicase n=1 Tax=Tepidibacillus sp. HK-1 TaxID=1883407 RepID=UPI000858711A|nr:SNF2-related protein [Tepidibacillus sp. HK-1]GBF10999.1 RNA polymerase-associated protein RapA [Tepidibacillus sp. HK-1]